MKLKLWMRVVGAFYLLLGVFNTPFIIESRLSAQYPDLGVPLRSPSAQALVDTWFMFGLEMLVIGAMLLYASRDAHRHVALAWTVIGLESVRGIADDVYLIARGHDAAVYSAWIVVHLMIILGGLRALGTGSSTDEATGDRSDPAPSPIEPVEAR